jgi:hypothetical protein
MFLLIKNALNWYPIFQFKNIDHSAELGERVDLWMEVKPGLKDCLAKF